MTKNETTLAINGKTIQTWKPNGRELREIEYWSTRDKNHLLIGAHESSVKISKVELRPLEAGSIAARPGGTGSFNTPKTTATTKALGKPVDLLTNLALAEAVVAGDSWSLENGVLSVPAGQVNDAVRMQFPNRMPAEYALTCIAERISGEHQLLFALPGSSGVIFCSIDAVIAQTDPPASGFTEPKTGTVLGVRAGERMLPMNEPVQVEIVVKDDATSLAINGNKIAAWKPDGRQLEEIDKWAGPQKNRLIIGSYMSGFKISRLEFKPLVLATVAGSQTGTAVDTDNLVGQFGETILDGDDPTAMDDDDPLTNNPGSATSRPTNLGKRQDPPRAIAPEVICLKVLR